MKMKHSYVLTMFVVGLLFLFSFGTDIHAESEKALIKKLAPKYKQWLDLVTHIIAKEERKTFLGCTNDRDREVFIKMFWKMRDPTPGTKENEFRAEHIKRFHYANKYYKYGAGRPGWMTDMGRIHIILGKPISTDRYEVDKIVHDCQLWSYYGDKRLHLPGHFYVLFYRRNGMGEYKLYDPIADGTYALLIKTQEVVSTMGTISYQKSYEYLKEHHPVLAMASLSLVPDENPTDFRPTFRSQTLIRNVLEVPIRKLNTKYATNFSKYKGIVEVKTTTNYVSCKFKVNVIKNRDLGLNFIHFSVLPERVSADFSQARDEYYFNYKLKVVLKQKNKNVFSYEKNYPVYIKDENEMKAKFSNSVILSDAFPVPKGKYNLNIIMNNSVNSELIYFDKNVVVGDEVKSAPTVMGPIVSKNVVELKRFAFVPYQFGDIEAVVNPNYNFGKKDALHIVGGFDKGNYKGELKGLLEIEDIFNKSKYYKSYPINLGGGQLSYFNKYVNVLPPGNYKLRLKLLSKKDTVLDMKDEVFSVSLYDYAKIPGTISKLADRDKMYAFYHIAGHQYRNLKQMDKAFMYLKKAYQLNKKSDKLLQEYSDMLLMRKDYETVLKIVEPLKLKKENHFIYNLIRGKALYLKGFFNDAIDHLEEANKIYDSDIRVLNVLGMAYLRMGAKEQAQKVFKASLKVNGEQKNIEKVLKSIDLNK